MKKFAALVYIPVFIFFDNIALAGNDGEAGALARMLAQSQYYSADFEQTVHDPDGLLVDSYSGKIALTRPGSLRWDIEQPLQQVLIVNEGRYFQYDEDIDQLLIEALSPQVAALPEILLSGEAGLIESEYRVQQRDEAQSSAGANRLSFTLTPLAEDALFESVTIDFANGHMQSLVIQDDMQQISRFVFSTISDKKIPKLHYQLDVPPHTDIIER